MNATQQLIAQLQVALEDSRALAESRRLEIVQLGRQLDEILRLAALQNEQLSDLRTMLRRNVTKRRKAGSETTDAAESEGDPPAGPAPHLSPEGSTKSENDPAKPDKPPRFRKPRPKGAGRRPAPSHLDSNGEKHEVCACKHCGSTRLLARDTEVTDRIDAVEMIARIRREVLEVVRCADCGKTTTAPPPPLPCEKSKFTCAFLAWVVTMKFVLLVPLDRMRRLLASQGLDIAESTLVRLIEIASDLASTVDGEHWRQIKASPCILSDATGLKVLVKGIPTAWDAYLDVFNVDELAVYQFALTKHGDELAGLFKGFRGVVMCDAESRLNEIFRTEGVRRANCNAHPRRAFRDAEAVQPTAAKEAGRFIAKMYEIERRALSEGLIGQPLRVRRQEQIRPIATTFRVWLTEHEKLLPSDLLGKAVRYYIRHFDDLTRFIDDPDIPIDNNPSERAFQDHAKLRLNALFAGSPEGGRRWAILPGVVTTAKRHGLDVQAYLTWLFERRGTWKKRFGMSIADLTPAAYKQMRDKQKRQLAA